MTPARESGTSYLALTTPSAREMDEEVEDIQSPSTTEAFEPARDLIESMVLQQPQSRGSPPEAVAPVPRN